MSTPGRASCYLQRQKSQICEHRSKGPTPLSINGKNEPGWLKGEPKAVGALTSAIAISVCVEEVDELVERGHPVVSCRVGSNRQGTFYIVFRPEAARKPSNSLGTAEKHGMMPAC